MSTPVISAETLKHKEEVEGPYGLSIVYNPRPNGSNVPFPHWKLSHGTDTISSAEVDGFFEFSATALKLLNATVKSFRAAFEKNRWGDEETGVYHETERFRFLQSDHLTEQGQAVYMGQGYEPNLIIQVKIGGAWHDVKVSM